MDKGVYERYQFIRNQRLAYNHEIELLDKEKLDVSELDREFVPAILYDSILRLFEVREIYYRMETEIEDIVNMMETYHFDVYLGIEEESCNIAGYLDNAKDSLDKSQRSLGMYADVYEKRINALAYRIVMDKEQAVEFFGSIENVSIVSKKVFDGIFISAINESITEIGDCTGKNLVQVIVDIMIEVEESS